MRIIAKDKIFPDLKEFIMMITTFTLTVFAWIFFRAESIEHAVEYVSEIFSLSLFKVPVFTGINEALTTVILLIFFILIEWHGRREQFAIAKIGLGRSQKFRWAFYSLLVFLIGMFMQTKETPFIYFQF